MTDRDDPQLEIDPDEVHLHSALMGGLTGAAFDVLDKSWQAMSPQQLERFLDLWKMRAAGLCIYLDERGRMTVSVVHLKDGRPADPNDEAFGQYL